MPPPRFILLLALAAAASWPAIGAAGDPFDFFRPQVSLTTDERSRLSRGEAVVKTLAPQPREAAIFAAARVGIGAERLVAWIRRIDALKAGPQVRAIGRFSQPPRVDDLAALTLDDEDLDDLRRCRPGSCALKLSGSEIRTLAAIAGPARAGWQQAVQSAFRALMVARVRDYLATGLAGVAPNHDRDVPVSPDAEFRPLLAHSTFLSSRLPALVGFLASFPGGLPPAGVESFVYWSKEGLGGKPIVSITHVTIGRAGDLSLPEAVVVSRQVFATHYVTGSLAVTAIVGGRGNEPGYLTYLNRSRVDVLDGLFGGFVRRLIERRLRDDAGGVVDALRRRVQGGDPP